jgi:hypothetical protein
MSRTPPEPIAHATLLVGLIRRSFDRMNALSAPATTSIAFSRRSGGAPLRAARGGAATGRACFAELVIAGDHGCYRLPESWRISLIGALAEPAQLRSASDERRGPAEPAAAGD